MLSAKIHGEVPERFSASRAQNDMKPARAGVELK